MKKNIDWVELVFAIFMISTCAVLTMLAISAYQDTQSRIKWRESTSLKTLEMVKHEAVNEYISKQVDYEAIHITRADLKVN